MNDWIIAGDINQDITSKEIERFFNKCEVEDIHYKFNNIACKEIDNIYKRGSRPIDTIVATTGIM